MIALMGLGAIVLQLLWWGFCGFVLLRAARYAYRFVTAPKESRKSAADKAPGFAPPGTLAPAAPPSTVSPAGADHEPAAPEPAAQPAHVDHGGGDGVDISWNPLKPVDSYENATLLVWGAAVAAGIIAVLSLIGAAAALTLSPVSDAQLYGNLSVAAVAAVLGLCACWRRARWAAICLLLLTILNFSGYVWALLRHRSFLSELWFALGVGAVCTAIQSVRGTVYLSSARRIAGDAAPSNAGMANTRRPEPPAGVTTADPEFMKLPIKDRAKIAWQEQRGFRRSLRKWVWTWAGICIGLILLLGVVFGGLMVFDTPHTPSAATPPAAAVQADDSATPAPTPPVAMAQANAAAQAHGEVTHLMAEWDDAMENCQGGDQDQPITQASCAKRDRLETSLNEHGWCYGTHDQTAAEYKWHPCTPGSIGYDPGE